MIAARARPLRRGRAATGARPRMVLVLTVVGLLLIGGWFWFRDSPLVSVDRVAVSGESGPDAARIRSALIAAGHSMTTLDVRIDQLRMAVAPFPVVKDLQVSAQFPHGLRIRVVEQVPVGVVVAGTRTIAVAADGTLLHDMVPSGSLPTIPLRAPPGGTRLSEADSLRAVALLAAAPYPILARISRVTVVPSHGLVAELRNGPSIYFGDATRPGAKWIAATAVLADAGSAGAAYIDVTDPQRPVAGATAPAAATSTAASTAPTAASTAPTAASTAPTAAPPTPSGSAPPGG